MKKSASIRLMQEGDAESLSSAFLAIGWNKPRERFESYLADQNQNVRDVLIAEQDGNCVGYVTIMWDSDYAAFKAAGIPEIVDLNVLPASQRHGIGTALLDAAEGLIRGRSSVAGIGVGLFSDYGAAQRLYVQRGYVPDGRGISYCGELVAAGERVLVDDDLILRLIKRFG